MANYKYLRNVKSKMRQPRTKQKREPRINWSSFVKDFSMWFLGCVIAILPFAICLYVKSTFIFPSNKSYFFLLFGSSDLFLVYLSLLICPIGLLIVRINKHETQKIICFSLLFIIAVISLILYACIYLVQNMQAMREISIISIILGIILFFLSVYIFLLGAEK